MIGLPSSTPIYLCTQPVDFRKGFDGLTGIVTTALGHSVTDGVLFLFVNHKRDLIKALWWETGGLTLWYRRLEQGNVELPKAVDGHSHVCSDYQENVDTSPDGAKEQSKRAASDAIPQTPIADISVFVR